MNIGVGMKLMVSFLIICACFIVTGCDKDDPVITNTPGDVLKSLTHVFNTSRDADEYRELLLSSYTFYFDPDDIGMTIGGGYVIPTSWTRDQDVSAITNMFAQAYNIQLTFSNLGDLETDPAGTTYTLNNINLELYLYPDGPGFAYLATGQCDFVFEKVGDLWYIKSWQDRTGNGMNSPTSFGGIKASYH
jgi:hypothetical protein